MDDLHRARERVRDDVALVGDVASTVSSALGLDCTNRTLGRNVVIAALDAHIAAESGDGGGERCRVPEISGRCRTYLLDITVNMRHIGSKSTERQYHRDRPTAL